jgi:hypothetical protein
MNLFEIKKRIEPLGFKYELGSSFVFIHKDFKMILYHLNFKIELWKTIEVGHLRKIYFGYSFEDCLILIQKEIKILKLKNINE